MAIMIPSSLDKIPFTTAGERKLFDLFQKTLPEQCIVRYEILLGEQNRRPDYTLIDPNRGILIVEVKDWGIDSIARATLEQFWVCGYGGSRTPKPNMNPSLKCQIYLRDAREQLSAMPALRDQAGHLQIPIDYYIAFPNIDHREFTRHSFDEVISPEHVLFKEDLVSTGTPFVQRYDQLLPKPETALTDEQVKAVTAALLPDLAIPVKGGFEHKDAGKVTLQAWVADTYNLSLNQEQIAKSLGEGPRLLRGIAGTGKTLIMLYRAKMLAANNKDARILILCWNVSLANYMRQVYDRVQFEAHGHVKIQHFSEFARDLLGPQECEPDDPQFNKRLELLTIRQSDFYDAIYVDEAQDFRQEWIAFLYHRLLKGKPDERNLLIAADDAQRIYHRRDFSWSALDIPMKGRSKILKTVYRNSARVWIFSSFLLGQVASYFQENPDKVQFSSKGGYDPQLIECRDLEAQVDQTIKIIQSMLSAGYKARNVLILYRHKNVGRVPLVEHLRKRLRQENIQHDWIAADDRNARHNFDWEADTVKISTVHSAKGMDSSVVIILGAETFQPEPSGPEDDTRLMYVALTRAREFLAILHTGRDGLVHKLHHCQEQYRGLGPGFFDQLESSGVS